MAEIWPYFAEESMVLRISTMACRAADFLKWLREAEEADSSEEEDDE